MEKPGERNLHRRGTEARGNFGQRARLERSEPTEWKERHIGDAIMGKIGDKRIVGSMSKIVPVLYADDGGDLSGLRDLRRRDIAQPDVTHQTLLLEFGQNCHWRLDRPLSRFMDTKHAAQVDDIEHIETEIAEIVMNSRSQLFAGESRNPRSILAATGADFGNDY